MNNKKRLVGIVLAAIMMISIFAAIVSTGGEIQSISSVSRHGLASLEEAIPGQAIVGFKDVMTMSVEQNALIGKYGGAVLDRNPVLNCVLVKVDDTQEFVTAISGDASVKYAEPNYIVRALSPNDPYYYLQWGLPAIKADIAWDTEKGDYDNITIAIVDTGIDYNHEDLGNYVSDGYDWVNDDNDPWDDNGHGTHCAGIAAAVMDNGIGIAGIAQVKVMAEKVLNETGYGSNWNVSEGITHAADQGADVISMSLGGYGTSSMLENACQYAWDEGYILVGAAGNDNLPAIMYPAKYDTVICVGAIDQDNQRCNYPSWGSNWGPEMELVAPGVDITSTCLGSYYYLSGTSMATPHVAGVAALVWSNCPELTNQQVRDRLDATADDLGITGWDEEYGYGRVDAEEAIECGIVPQPDIWVDPTSFDVTLPPDTIYSRNLTIGNDGNATLIYEITDTEGGVSGVQEPAAKLEFSGLGLKDLAKEVMETTGSNNIIQSLGVTSDDYEIAYDDGEMDYAFWWDSPGAASGVHFTSPAYHTLKTIRFYIYSDLTAFDWKVLSWTGTQPGSVIASGTTTPTSSGWHDVDVGSISVPSDFVIAIYWKEANRPTLGSDDDPPIDYRSWDFNGVAWSPWNADDYMIRAVMSTEEGWLSESPTSGTVEPMTQTNITVTFNTTGLSIGDYYANINITSNDPDESLITVPVNLTVKPVALIFDAEQPKNPYPSIFGTHNGTITPNVTIYNVSRLYTYPCAGTGGHSESVAFFNATTEIEIANGTWNGYPGAGDYHYIELNVPITLQANEPYNYTICTGSYPQIHHNKTLPTANGWINCTKFTDANGKEYSDGIPAIRLEQEERKA